MKKVVIVIICLLAIFSVLRAYSAEEESRFNIHPGAIEFRDKDSELSIGFGLMESGGDQSRIWNLFPVKISVDDGKKKFYLALNGLSFLTGSGINFEKPLVIKGVHDGDVISFGGKVTISGKVEGDVWVFGTDVVLETGGEVIGEVVALGGNITQNKQSVIRGNKYSLPELKIPFIGLLSSGNSIQTIRFFIELFNIALFLLILFLLLFFRLKPLSSQAERLFSYWKQTLLFLLLSLITIPVLFVFLVATIAGILMLPVLALFLIITAYYGFSSFAIRMGKLFLRREGGGMGHYYLCGLIGLLLLKGPALLGILLTLLNADILVIIGNILTVISSIALFIAFSYGFGISLVNLRAGAPAEDEF